MRWHEEEYAEVSVLLGKTIIEIEELQDELVFRTSDGETYKMYHEQDCCENVWLEDTTGDLKDLLNSPLTMSEVVTNDGSDDEDAWESRTWTFYKFATINGYVTLRWCGESNGYYSETVDFKKVTK